MENVMAKRSVKREALRELREIRAQQWQAVEEYTDSLLKIEEAKTALAQAQADAAATREKARKSGVSPAELRSAEQLVAQAVSEHDERTTVEKANEVSADEASDDDAEADESGIESDADDTTDSTAEVESNDTMSGTVNDDSSAYVSGSQSNWEA